MTGGRRDRHAGVWPWKRGASARPGANGCWNGRKMVLQPCLFKAAPPPQSQGARRFLVLYLPYWPSQYLKRADPALCAAPLALYERIKGGLRLAALDPALLGTGLRVGQSLAEARAIRPGLVVRALDRDM